MAGESESLEEKKASAIAGVLTWMILKIIKNPLISTGLATAIGISIGGGFGSSITNWAHGTRGNAKMDSVLEIITPMAAINKADHVELKMLGKDIRKLRGSFLELKGARQATARYEEKDRAYQRERQEHGDTTTSEASPDSVEHLVVNHFRHDLDQ